MAQRDNTFEQAAAGQPVTLATSDNVMATLLAMKETLARIERQLERIAGKGSG